jgi:hypothetical protein
MNKIAFVEKSGNKKSSIQKKVVSLPKNVRTL